MEFIDIVKSRYSCRKFTAKPVEQEKLDIILEAGRWAPTAKNLQEQHIYVIRTEAQLAKIDALTPFRYGAPLVLAVAYDKNNVYTYPGDKFNSGAEDATIVATHMILAAATLGIDSCWLNHYNPDLAAQAFGLPENEEIVMLMDLGYAAEDAQPAPKHFERKPIEETVTYLE